MTRTSVRRRGAVTAVRVVAIGTLAFGLLMAIGQFGRQWHIETSAAGRQRRDLIRCLERELARANRRVPFGDAHVRLGR